ncbi:hypothetical protein [Rubritalea tangerina]|uniref:hypothetical protein n=1 Tax=Rubritalea tangerina TaxID=430798 RepID=UPI00360CA3A3
MLANFRIFLVFRNPTNFRALAFNTQHSTLNTQHSTFRRRRPLLSILCFPWLPQPLYPSSSIMPAP